jgi:catechol 2,3-dioxygenase
VSKRRRSLLSPLTPPQPLAIAPRRIHPDTRPAFIHLRVGSLERVVPFYRDVLGLQVIHLMNQQVVLGVTGRNLVVLQELPQGKRYRGVCGLYHFAILLPDRRALARAIARLFALRYPNYPTDHIMIKTTYLEDPEGNQIELYCESPEDGIFALQNGDFFARRSDGTWSDGREALDVEALFAHLNKADRLDEPLPPQTVIGHFHLHVADLEQTRRFYHEQLGFDDMGVAPRFRMGMVSAGGYHHHIGYNTWQGEGAPPAPLDALGLAAIAFLLPNRKAWKIFCERLKETSLPYEWQGEGILISDPSGNKVLFLPPLS